MALNFFRKGGQNMRAMERKEKGGRMVYRGFLLLVALLGIGWVTAMSAYGQQVTLRYWDFIDPKLDNPRSRALATHIDRFEKSNPNIKISPEIMPWHQVAPQIIQAAAANRTPDVARVLIWDLPQLVKAGTAMSLNEFTDRWPSSVRNDFLIDWNATVWDGKKMAIPYEHRVFVLWYRKDLLKAAGLKVPKTVDELIEAGRMLNKGNIQGMVIGLSRASQASALAEWFYPMLWAGGGDLMDSSGNPIFNGEAGVRAMQVLADLVRKGAMPSSVVAYTYEEIFQGVKAGTIAMTGLGSHRVVTAREAGNLGDKLQTAWLPGYTREKPAPAHVMGWLMMMGKDCKNKEAAWKFIEHITSPESQIITAKTTGEMPTRKSPYNDPWFKTKEASELMFWKDYMEKYGRMPRYPEKYVELSQLIADAAQEVVLRNVKPKDALNKAVQRYKELTR
jgi:multiple sugar transport system substrate-binding protein